MSEPRTEAGRRLLRGVVTLRHRDNVDAAYECESGVDRCHDCIEDWDAILAIEAEATPDPRVERLEAALDKLKVLRFSGEVLDALSQDPDIFIDWDEYDEFVRLDEVRALLRSPQERSGE